VDTRTEKQQNFAEGVGNHSLSKKLVLNVDMRILKVADSAINVAIP
jgi:hypothetical protein